MNIRAFSRPDEDDVVRLWERCDLTRPWNDPRKDIQRKLALRPDQFLVGELDGRIVATTMAGYDGHRGWLYYVAVDPDFQGRGLGRAIITAAEALLLAEGCPKVNLQVRTTNTAVLEFYERLGYVDNEVLGLGKRLISDE